MNTYEITDERVLKEIKKADNEYLTFRLLEQGLSKEDREGRSDMELLISEVEWLIYLYDCDDTIMKEDLKEARHILKEIRTNKNAKKYYDKYKEYPYWIDGVWTKQCIDGVKWAREKINEYNRFRSLIKRLDKYELEQRSDK